MMTKQENEPGAGRIFLCHSSGDKESVRELCQRLRADGFSPWFDENDLVPGQDWELEIRRAVRSSAVVLVCLSRSSITKAGFVHKEIKYALDVADEQPEGTIYIIPVRLEDCDVPERLRRWQWVDLYEQQGYALLVRALGKKIPSYMPRMPRHCAVFVSSTSEDLREYRFAAREACLAVGLRPEMMEYFATAGGPPLDECLARVSPCDVVVAIVAERYGWVPPDQPTDEAKSITWLECEHAVARGCELLVFFSADPNAWRKERSEAFRLADAAQNGTFTPELADQVQRNIAHLRDFRKWLETGRTRATFTTPDDLKAQVTQALYQWLDRHPDCRPSRPPARRPDNW